jgi:pSer/pThr/pTyr-binding forkhead associated (FHA) protein
MQQHTDAPGIPASSQIELQIRSEPPMVFCLQAPIAEGYIIGRSDPTHSSYVPDVDLVNCNGAEHGVSRRHAALVRYNDTICLIDLNSSNGTFVNGEKLRGDTPYTLHPDDKIRFGTLYVYITLTQNC